MKVSDILRVKGNTLWISEADTEGFYALLRAQIARLP